ncbi:MAG: VOC family protein [Ideonella sp.]|nr:VOC family protein [Ideonella sp.]MCC7458353.1 VOC family protein [Nitrospira sp.]
MKLNTARVFVRDIARSRAFYEHTLGLRLKNDGSARGFCVFDAGTCELVLEAVPVDAPAQALVGRVTGLAFNVANVHLTYQQLKAKGVEFSAAPQLQFWGGTLATLRDPDGNELQIAHRPPA